MPRSRCAEDGRTGIFEPSSERTRPYCCYELFGYDAFVWNGVLTILIAGISACLAEFLKPLAKKLSNQFLAWLAFFKKRRTRYKSARYAFKKTRYLADLYTLVTRCNQISHSREAQKLNKPIDIRPVCR